MGLLRINPAECVFVMINLRRLLQSICISGVLYYISYEKSINYFICLASGNIVISSGEWFITLFSIVIIVSHYYMLNEDVFRTIVLSFLAYLVDGYIATSLRIATSNDVVHFMIYLLYTISTVIIIKLIWFNNMEKSQRGKNTAQLNLTFLLCIAN